MHITIRGEAGPRIRPAIWTSLLAAALILVVVGCGGAGSNSEGGEGGEDGGNDGEDDTTAPAAPSGLSGDARDGAVSLSWEVVDAADTYRVYRAQSSTDGVEGSALATDLSETNYKDTGAENGTAYFYRVTSVDGSGNESGGSGEVKRTPFAPPSELAGTSGDSQILLEWSAAAGAKSYSVYRAQSSTNEATGDPLATGITEASYTDTSAVNGTKYYYRVTSVNPEDEESPSSGEVEKSAFSNPPDPPDG